jgi:hypothetical protein
VKNEGAGEGFMSPGIAPHLEAGVNILGDAVARQVSPPFPGSPTDLYTSSKCCEALPDFRERASGRAAHTASPLHCRFLKVGPNYISSISIR